MKQFLVITLFVAAMYCGFISFLVLSKGYSLAHMDWNGDGNTTISEMIRAKDIGVKAVDDECLEYYQLKDGLLVRSVCP